MGKHTCTAPPPIPPHVLDTLATAVRKAAEALAQVEAVYSHGSIPGDAYTAETAYPFALSLDEQVAELWAWADAVGEDADVANGRA